MQKGAGEQPAEEASAVSPAATRTNHILVCISKSTASRLRKVIIPLYLTPVGPWLGYCLGHPRAKGIFTNWRGSREGHQDGQDAGAHTARAEAERAGFVQPADEKTKRGI